MSERHPRALEIVSGLIRDPILPTHLEEDNVAHLEGTIGAHGTRVKRVVNLAINGEFDKKVDSLEEGFLISPNLNYPSWSETELSEGIAVYGKYQLSTFETAIQHSAIPTREEYTANIWHNEDDIVVVTFSSGALEPPSDVPEPELDALEVGAFVDSGMTGEPRLFLPEPPSIDAVSGIYPIGLLAAHMLKTALDKLRSEG